VPSALAAATAQGWARPVAAVAGRHTHVKLLASPVTGDRLVRLALIRTTGERSQGLASAALTDLCAVADAHELTLCLTPQPMGKGLTARQLACWYARHGFLPNRGRRLDPTITDSMVRVPR
jgi:hypothetical protein